MQGGCNQLATAQLATTAWLWAAHATGRADRLQPGRGFFNKAMPVLQAIILEAVPVLFVLFIFTVSW